MDRIIRIRLDSRQAEQGIDRLDNDMRGLGRTSDGIQTKLTAVASALAAAFSVQQITAYADAYTNIQNRLRVVTDSTEQLTRVTASLLQTANDTRASFDATSSLYSTLARSTEELAISEERLIAITKTINQTFAVSGASADEAANAIRQLSQALAAGALRGDEFNSVAEQAPGILRAVANETGKSVGQLREFAAEGGITAELLIRAIENYASTAQAEIDKTNRTFQGAAAVAQNNATAFVGSSKLVQEATQAAGNALVNLTENLDAVALALTTITAVIAGRYAAALVLAAVNTARVTAANLAAKTTYDALGVAVTRTTAAQNASVVASRASAAALALIGGPVGAAILAAGGLAYFVTQAISSQREAERLANTARGLNSELEKTNKIYENYRKSQDSVATQSIKGLGQAELQAQFRKSSDLVELYRGRIEQLKESGASYARIAAVEERLKGEQAILDAINSASPQIAKNAEMSRDLALRLADLAAQVNLTSIEYSVFAERQRLIKDGFSTNEIDKYIESYRALLQLQESNRAKAKTGSDIDALFSGSDNLFSGSTPSAPAQESDTSARINDRIAGLRQETALIQQELLLRKGVQDGLISEELMGLQMQTSAKILQAQTERELLFAEQTLTNEQKLATEAAYQEQVTAIAQEYAQRRQEVERAEMMTRIGLTESFASSAISVISAFSSKSFQAQKNAAIATGLVNIGAGVAKALNNPYPANLGFAAAVAAQGASLINTIKSVNPSGQGGSSFSSGGAATLPTQPQAAPFVGNFEIAGLSALQEQLDRLDPDEVLPVSFTRRLVASLSSVQRLEGGA